ncbi:unnamed protein product [Brassica rapa subsp. trilocularis]
MEREQLIYEHIEYYLNERKQHLNKLQRMLNIGICVSVGGILFTGWYGGIITVPMFQN